MNTHKFHKVELPRLPVNMRGWMLVFSKIRNIFVVSHNLLMRILEDLEKKLFKSQTSKFRIFRISWIFDNDIICRLYRLTSDFRASWFSFQECTIDVFKITDKSLSKIIKRIFHVINWKPFIHIMSQNWNVMARIRCISSMYDRSNYSESVIADFQVIWVKLQDFTLFISISVISKKWQ